MFEHMQAILIYLGCVIVVAIAVFTAYWWLTLARIL